MLELVGDPVPRNRPQTMYLFHITRGIWLDATEGLGSADVLLSAFCIRCSVSVPLLRLPAHSLLIYPGIGKADQYELYPKIPPLRRETTSESSE
jgi:hypothetical protein